MRCQMYRWDPNVETSDLKGTPVAIAIRIYTCILTHVDIKLDRKPQNKTFACVNSRNIIEKGKPNQTMKIYSHFELSIWAQNTIAISNIL